MPTSVSCVIVDDEPLAIEILKRHILAIPPLELLATFTHPVEAMDYLRSHPPQLVFLDIDMPSLSGLALSALLPKETTLIFTTAFRQYATEGFEREALDYLVKPISFDRFAKAINRYFRFDPAVTKASPLEESEPFVYIKIDKAMVKVLLHQICYVESLKNYIRIKTVDKDLISYHTLGFMEDKLPQRQFRRVHKSYIVNLGKIESFTSEYVAVSTGAVARKEIPLGGLYKESILEILRDRSI